MDLDYTFKNELIRKYFEGDDSYIPTGELMYLHQHPLVTPNFLTELEQIILDAGKVVARIGKPPQHLVKSFEDKAIALGKGLGTGVISEESAVQILAVMRDLYKFSNDIIVKLK